MDQQKRLLLAIALSFGLTLVWTNFIWKPQAEAELAAMDAGVELVVDGGTAVVAAPPPAVLEDGGVAEIAPSEPPPAEAALREIKIDRPTTRMVFTTEGAGLVSAELTGEREREEKHLTIAEGWQKLFGKKFEPAPHMNLARPVLGTSPNLGLSITGANPVTRLARYEVVEETPEKVVFKTRQGVWEVTRTFTWNQKPPHDTDPTPYVSELGVTVKNVSGSAQQGELGVHTVRSIDVGAEEAPSMFGGIGNQASVLCRHDDDVLRKTPPSKGWFSSGEPEWAEEKQGALSFVGIDQQYFLTVLWPKDAAVTGRCVVTAKPNQREAAMFMPLTLQPGESMTRTFNVFMGPKDLSMLQNLDASGFDARLEKTVDFGLWAFICKILIFFLRFFQNLVGNWGVAIILLTVMVKVLLLPLTHKAMVSAEAMKKLQPKMEEIRKKHPDDREKQNLEMMKLYQEAKMNPLGGCLPMLVQLPIWAALFTTLRTSYELYGEPFFGVWSNLTTKDPTYILPLLLGVTMIVTQRLQPQMMDKQQALLMTWVMPVFFTAIMMNYPAGLALYIFTNNLLSIVQQFALRRYLASKENKPGGPTAGALK